MIAPAGPARQSVCSAQTPTISVRHFSHESNILVIHPALQLLKTSVDLSVSWDDDFSTILIRLTQYFSHTYRVTRAYGRAITAKNN